MVLYTRNAVLQMIEVSVQEVGQCWEIFGCKNNKFTTSAVFIRDGRPGCLLLTLLVSVLMRWSHRKYLLPQAVAWLIKKHCCWLGKASVIIASTLFQSTI